MKMKNRFNRQNDYVCPLDLKQRDKNLRFELVIDYDPITGDAVVVGTRDRVAEINNISATIPSNQERYDAFANGDIYALGVKKGVYADAVGMPTNVHDLVKLCDSARDTLRNNATVNNLADAHDVVADKTTNDSEVVNDEQK